MEDKRFGPEGWTPDRLGSLAGKTYVITGANAGTGFQASRTLLSKGAKVVMLNRNAEKSTAAVAKLKQEFGVLVEKMLNPRRYQKWNNNAGFVHGQLEAAQPALDQIEEEDEDEQMNDDDDDDAMADGPSMANDGVENSIVIMPKDVPQAFSHFTYLRTNRKMLVCDLQGVFDDTSEPPPVFELTDPVIHYASNKGRKNVYGRTDKGRKGIHEFFKTQRCNELCALLKLSRKHWTTSKQEGMSDTLPWEQL